MAQLFFRHLIIPSLMVVFLSGKTALKAQSFDYSTPSNHNIQFVPVVTNPSIKQDNQTTLIGDYHSYLGAFSDVNYTNINGLINLNEKRTLGVAFLHESTSDFFSRTRLYGLYQEHVQLNKRTWFSMGAKVGFINFNMKALGGTAGGSAVSPDLALGLSLKNKKYLFGVSLEQVTQPKLKPIEYVFHLKRVTELHASYFIELSPYVKYKPEIRHRFQVNSQQIRINNLFEFYEMIGFSANYLYEQGYTVNAFYKNNKPKTDGFQFFVSYFFPTGDLEKVDAAQFEIGAVLFFNGK